MTSFSTETPLPQSSCRNEGTSRRVLMRKERGSGLLGASSFSIAGHMTTAVSRPQNFFCFSAARATSHFNMLSFPQKTDVCNNYGSSSITAFPFPQNRCPFPEYQRRKICGGGGRVDIMIWENQDIYRLSFSTAAVHNTLRALTSGEMCGLEICSYVRPQSKAFFPPPSPLSAEENTEIEEIEEERPLPHTPW